jgi:hypothetical protein
MPLTATICNGVTGWPVQCGLFAARFLSRARFSFASALRKASFGTVMIFRKALSKRSHSVFPGTYGAGSGFMLVPSYTGFKRNETEKDARLI